MDAGWVAAIASVASAFIVGLAATAAMLQIRHIRNANEVAVYLHLVDRLETAGAAEAFRSYQDFAQRVKTDGLLRRRLAQSPPVPEFSEIERLLRFLDNLTMLIFTGSLTERLILNQYAAEIVQLWDPLAEAVYLRRYGMPHFASAFEHLAMRAKTSLAKGEIDRFYEHLLHDPRMTGTMPPEPADQ